MRILITSIGSVRMVRSDDNTTSSYQKTSYSFQKGEDSFKTSFLFEAILNHHQEIQQKIDQLVLVGTVHSGWEKLLQYYMDEKPQKNQAEMQSYCQKLQELSKTVGYLSSIDELNIFQSYLHELDLYLQQILDGSGKLKVNIILLQYGLSEEESAYNYAKLCSSIEALIPEHQKHELLLDITHSFRSLPIYQFLIINYFIRISSRNVWVSNVYYGMFELTREAALTYTPVINMNHLITTMDWINGINELKSYGSVYDIMNNLEENSNIAQWLEVFEWATNTNNYNLLTRSIDELANISLQNQEYSAIAVDALKTISQSLQNLFGTRSKSHGIAQIQLCLSEWFFKQRRYGLAIIAIQECVKSYMADIIKEQHDSKKMTEEALQYAGISHLRTLSKKDSKAKTLFGYYMKSKKMRNTMAHNLRTTKVNGLEINTILVNINTEKRTLKNYIKYVKNCIKNEIIDTISQTSSVKKITNKPVALKSTPPKKTPNNSIPKPISKPDTKVQLPITSNFTHIFFVGETKEKWNWVNILHGYHISKENLIFVNLPKAYNVDYQLTKDIENECLEIESCVKKAIEETHAKNFLIVLGHTNFEKIAFLNKLFKKNAFTTLLISERYETSSNQTYVFCKKIPQY